MVEVMILITAAAGFVRMIDCAGQATADEQRLIPLALPRSRGTRFSLWTWLSAAIACWGSVSLLVGAASGDRADRTAHLDLRAAALLLLLRATRPSKQTLLRCFGARPRRGRCACCADRHIHVLQPGRQLLFRRIWFSHGWRASTAPPITPGCSSGARSQWRLAFALVSLDRRRRMLAGLALCCHAARSGFSRSARRRHTYRRARRRDCGPGCRLSPAQSLPPIIAAGALAIGAFAALTRLSDRLANLLDFSSGTTFVRLRVWESSHRDVARPPVDRHRPGSVLVSVWRRVH